MKFLAWLIAIVLIPVAVATSLLFVSSRTVLSGSFVKSQLLKTDIYTDASNYLSEQIAGDTNTATKQAQADQVKVQETITPIYLQAQFESVIDQAEAIAHGTSTSLQINFNDAISKLQVDGLPVKNDVVKPINFSLNDQPTVAKAVKESNNARLGIVIAFVVLLLLLVIFSWTEKMVAPLITLLTFVGLIDLGLFIGLKQAPKQIISKLSSDNEQISHFLPKIELLINNVATSLASNFLLLAIVSFVLIIGLIVAYSIRHNKSQNKVILP